MNQYDLLLGILPSLFGLSIMLFFTVFLLVVYIKSSNSEKYFKINVIVILKDTEADLSVDKIENAHATYKNNRSGFGYYRIVDLCQKLAEELRTEKYIKYCKTRTSPSMIANKLDRVIDLLNEKYRVDNEKANELLDELSMSYKDKTDTIRKIEHYIIALTGFYKGSLSEKDARIFDLEKKLMRKHWFTWIVGIIGFLGSIVSIYSVIK